jgi:predicted nucleotidyltransferase component of viral defense system
MLFYETIHAQTLGLLKKLQSEDLFSNLRLVGGTSLALQIGHRISVDIDLFGDLKCDNITLNNTLKSLAQYRIIQQTENIHIYNIENIKVDVVNYPYPWLQAPVTKDGLTLAAIEDIAAMKLAAITGRGSKKDFIDLYFLLQRFSLEELLHLYSKKYNEGSVFMVLRSLAYFDDAEEELMPKMFVDIKWEKVKETIIDKLKSFQSSQ